MKKKYYDFYGEKLSVRELAEKAGVSLYAMKWRIKNRPMSQWMMDKVYGTEKPKPAAGWGGLTENVDKIIEQAKKKAKSVRTLGECNF